MNQTIQQRKSADAIDHGVDDKKIVSFVIPALNEEKWIGSCLDAIDRLLLPECVASLELIVVDNQSTDRTAEVSCSKGANVICCPPGNPARARNAGADLAKGDWLVFVDADCCLDSQWLLQCAKAMKDDGAVATGSQIIPPPTLSLIHI